MRSFREFVETYEQMKRLVLNALDPQRSTIDPDSKSVLNKPLSDFKLRKDLLTTPMLSDIIRTRRNAGAIMQAIKNDQTTIGNLLALLTQEPNGHSEPKYLG